MNTINKLISPVFTISLLIGSVGGYSPLLHAKSCHAASSQGQGGLNCGPAPVSGGVGQTTGQVTGTKPGQIGSPTIHTSNQNPSTKPPVSTVPDLPKAPIEGPKADPVRAPNPVPPARSVDVISSPPVAPPAALAPVAVPAATPQFAAPVVAPPMIPQQTPVAMPPLPRAPIEGPRVDPIRMPDPVPPPVSVDVMAGLPVMPPAALAPVAVPAATPQLAAPVVAPPMIPQQTPVAMPPLPRAPIEGPKADPIRATDPLPPPVSVDVMAGLPVVPPGALAPVAVPAATPQFAAPVAAPPMVPQQTPAAMPPLPKAPIEGPRVDPIRAPDPKSGIRSTDVLSSPVASAPPVAVPVPAPLVMSVAPRVEVSRHRDSPGKAMPVTVPTSASTPSLSQPTITGSPRPQPSNSAASEKGASKQAGATGAATSGQPVLVVTSDAATANQNEKMITVMPGRQPANNYPSFNVNSTTPNRTCVVSGLERRKTVDANGVETYQGTLPTFRMVVTELADLPAWHPLDSGCIISVTHKR